MYSELRQYVGRYNTPVFNQNYDKDQLTGVFSIQSVILCNGQIKNVSESRFI